MRRAILLTTLLFLTACGQKGPLYLEKLEQEVPKEAPKEVPEETQEEETTKPEVQGK